MSYRTFPLLGHVIGCLLIGSSFFHAHGQPNHNLDAFAPLDLPPPNGQRLATGAPGPDYWQQRADYTISVALDPSVHRIEGSVTITYTNNSPHVLPFVWVHLDQNAFAEKSQSAQLQAPNSRWRGAFSDGGFNLSHVEIVQDGDRHDANYSIFGTLMRIDLPKTMPPNGSTIDIDIAYDYVIPQYGADRTGWLDVEQGTIYEIAQWYPRMVVYDDVEGWNTLPYLGQGEFYLGYGDFNLALTVPHDFIVVATGELQNPGEVLTQQQQERLDEARLSDATVHIIRPREVGSRTNRPSTEEHLTWRFQATNVRDVAWAASQAFIWDAASWDGVLAMSVYPKESIGTRTDPGWEASTQYVRHSLQFYSEQWTRYPFPVAINVAGPVGGMEYPMMAFCGYDRRDQRLFAVTDHEFGHTWFPMVVGSNERMHAWMDEGFNSFINHDSNYAFYGENAIRLGRLDSEYIAEQMQAPTADQPSFTRTDLIRRAGHGFLSYRKPAKGLQILREHVLGRERFDSALRAYIVRWAYKHPQPADFFRTIEDVTGTDLAWFWRGWFYGTGTLDHAIADISFADNLLQVTIENRGDLILPAKLAITYQDGTVLRRSIPVEVWAQSNVFPVVIENGFSVVSLELDPDAILPDIAPENDRWVAPPESNTDTGR